MGKQALVRQYFEQRASAAPLPLDWCYVNHFDDSRKPHAPGGT
jgi:hypothetical protein